MPLLEQNIYALWVGKQTAKGTPNTTPGRHPIMVGGNMGFARDDGSENYSDLTKYGAQTDWVNSLAGSGEPVLEATPVELAYLLWLFHGGETVTAVAAQTGPPAVPAVSRHTFTPAATYGHWLTAYLRVGSSVIRRHRYNDSLITRVAIEASTANKAMRVTPRIVSLDPSEVFTADPAAAIPAERPFLFTDAAVGQTAGATVDGSITIDGTVYRGVTQFALTIDDAWDFIYGDDARPYDLVQGTPSVTVGTTIYTDAAGLARWNALAYGTTTPSVGQKPLRGIPALGSLVGVMRQRDSTGAFNGLEFNANVPGVKWTIPDAPAPNPDGGTSEIALAGTMRPVSGQPAYTVRVDCPTGVAAFTT